VYHRYLYNGERVLQDLTDGGDWHTTYTTENGSYEGTLVGIKRYNLDSERFPIYDEIGTAHGLVCELGTVTDTYELDTFGTPSGPAQGTTPNPYRYGAAWGYITDPSGLLQLGARYYWPEVGRFVSQDPEKDGADWYAYARNNPLGYVDADGQFPWVIIAGVIGGVIVVYEAYECIQAARWWRRCMNIARGIYRNIDSGAWGDPEHARTDQDLWQRAYRLASQSDACTKWRDYQERCIISHVP